jgi:hypothetical protein
MAIYLNQDISFDEVRWATMRKTSYDSRASFGSVPDKTLLSSGTRLYRLVYIANDRPFDGPWWIPKLVFEELRNDASGSQHGGGPLFRNYVAQYMALPSGSFQLCVLEIELTAIVYAWVGRSSPLFGRPGGMQQVFLPNLAESGEPRVSPYARLVHTYWLRF